MDEIQAKIHELQQLRKDMDGAEGVDAQELEDVQAGLDSLDLRWDTLTDEIESEDQRYYTLVKVSSCSNTGSIRDDPY